MLAYYIDATRQAMEDKARLERLVEAEASKPRWKRRVDSVRCLKGIDVMSAADLVFEAGEFSRFKNARSFAAWIGADAVEALQRRERAAGRHHEGGQQASEARARRVGVALPGMLSPFERPGQRPSAGPRREAPCRQGREKARRQAGRDARARRPQEQGQRRDRPRARMLVLGDRLHGRERLAFGKAVAT